MSELTKLTACRKAFKDYTADEVRLVSANLIKVIESKEVEEASLKAQLEPIEEARRNLVESMEKQGITPPSELSQPYTIRHIMPKRRSRKTKKEMERDAMMAKFNQKDNVAPVAPAKEEKVAVAPAKKDKASSKARAKASSDKKAEPYKVILPNTPEAVEKKAKEEKDYLDSKNK